MFKESVCLNKQSVITKECTLSTPFKIMILYLNKTFETKT